MREKQFIRIFFLVCNFITAGRVNPASLSGEQLMPHEEAAAKSEQAEFISHLGVLEPAGCGRVQQRGQSPHTAAAEHPAGSSERSDCVAHLPKV